MSGIELDYTAPAEITNIAIRHLTPVLSADQKRKLLSLITQIQGEREVASQSAFLYQYLLHGVLATLDSPFENRTIHFICTVVLLVLYFFGAAMFPSLCGAYLVLAFAGYLTEHRCRIGEGTMCSDLVASTYKFLEVFECTTNTMEVTPSDFTSTRTWYSTEGPWLVGNLGKHPFALKRKKYDSERAYIYENVTYAFASEDITTVQTIMTNLAPLLSYKEA